MRRQLARPVLERMLALGRGGRRDGGGFYDHHTATGRQLWAGLASVFPPTAQALPPLYLRQRLRCAETEGLRGFTELCSALALTLGPQGARFVPSPWLDALANDGNGLARWRHATTSGERR